MSTFYPKFIDVTVVDGTQPPVSRAGFEIPLFITPTKVISGIQSYTSSTAMIQAGFAANSPAVEFASLAFQGIGAPSLVKIGALTYTDTDVTVLEGYETGDKVSVNVNISGVSQVISVTTTEAQTTAEVATALATEIAKVTTVASAQATEAVINVILDANSKVSIGYGDFTSVEDTTEQDVATELANLQQQDNNFYFLSSSLHDKADQEKIAAFAQENDKLYVFSSQDPAALVKATTTDIFSILQSNGTENAVGMGYGTADQVLPEGAMVGYFAAVQPQRSNTMNAATLTGVTVSKYNDTERESLVTKNANLYTTVNGYPWFWDGRTSNGKFADFVRFKHWVAARTKEALTSRFKWSSDRLGAITYKQSDMYILEDAIMNEVITPAILGGTVANELVQDAQGKTVDLRPKITFPSRADIPASDIADRLLDNVLVELVYNAPIHRIKVLVDIQLSRTAQ